jgi:hypothetical protein
MCEIVEAPQKKLWRNGLNFTLSEFGELVIIKIIVQLQMLIMIKNTNWY